MSPRKPIEAPKERRRPTRPWKRAVMARRREEAEDRQAVRDARGDEGQLARLDELFGPDLGALRERTRLHKRLEKAA